VVQESRGLQTRYKEQRQEEQLRAQMERAQQRVRAADKAGDDFSSDITRQRVGIEGREGGGRQRNASTSVALRGKGVVAAAPRVGAPRTGQGRNAAAAGSLKLRRLGDGVSALRNRYWCCAPTNAGGNI